MLQMSVNEHKKSMYFFGFKKIQVKMQIPAENSGRSTGVHVQSTEIAVRSVFKMVPTDER